MDFDGIDIKERTPGICAYIKTYAPERNVGMA
jgi:hypothetical protein